LPLALRPLSATDLLGQRPGSVRVVETNPAEVTRHRAISLVRGHGPTPAPGRDLLEVLQKLFGPVR
jgi:hypothetical protein